MERAANFVVAKLVPQKTAARIKETSVSIAALSLPSATALDCTVRVGRLPAGSSLILIQLREHVCAGEASAGATAGRYDVWSGSCGRRCISLIPATVTLKVSSPASVRYPTSTR